jgi:UDP-N-acetylmuramate dehydrogenase
MREGDARVFERHANIIVNGGRATCADVLRLAARMKLAVKERFGVDLVEEVRRLGP